MCMYHRAQEGHMDDSTKPVYHGRAIAAQLLGVPEAATQALSQFSSKFPGRLTCVGSDWDTGCIFISGFIQKGGPG